MEISLNAGELMLGVTVGISRQLSNLKNGRRHRYGSGDNAWDLHIEGACGELAVAKYYNCYWSGRLGDYDAPDVGLDIDVRTCPLSNGCLIVHPGDDDERWFVLAIGRAPHFTLVGRKRGRECKQQEWWSDPSGEGRWAYFVPQSMLEPL